MTQVQVGEIYFLVVLGSREFSAGFVICPLGDALMIRLGAILSLPAKHYCRGGAAVSASASLSPGMV